MKLTKKEINIINELSEKCKISSLETVNYLLENKEALEICGLSKINKKIKFILPPDVKKLFFRKNDFENINNIKSVNFKSNINKVNEINFNIEILFKKLLKPLKFKNIDYKNINSDINILFSDIVFENIIHYFKKSHIFTSTLEDGKYLLSKTHNTFNYKKYNNLGDFLLEYYSHKNNIKLITPSNIEDYNEELIKSNLLEILNIYFIKKINTEELEFIYKHIMHYIYKIKIRDLFCFYSKLRHINYFKNHKNLIKEKTKKNIIENKLLITLNKLFLLKNIKIHIINEKNIHTIINLSKYSDFEKDFLILMAEDLVSKYLHNKITIVIEEFNFIKYKNKKINFIYGLNYNNLKVKEIKFNEIQILNIFDKNVKYIYKNFHILK